MGKSSKASKVTSKSDSSTFESSGQSVKSKNDGESVSIKTTLSASVKAVDIIVNEIGDEATEAINFVHIKITLNYSDYIKCIYQSVCDKHNHHKVKIDITPNTFCLVDNNTIHIVSSHDRTNKKKVSNVDYFNSLLEITTDLTCCDKLVHGAEITEETKFNLFQTRADLVASLNDIENVVYTVFSRDNNKFVDSLGLELNMVYKKLRSENLCMHMTWTDSFDDPANIKLYESAESYALEIYNIGRNEKYSSEITDISVSKKNDKQKKVYKLVYYIRLSRDRALMRIGATEFRNGYTRRDYLETLKFCVHNSL